MEDRERRPREIQEAIRHVLLHEWDPLGVSQCPETQDEYDSYVGGVYRLLASGASVAEIDQHLRHIEVREMGLYGATDRSAAATKLVALNVRLQGGSS